MSPPRARVRDGGAGATRLLGRARRRVLGLDDSPPFRSLAFCAASPATQRLLTDRAVALREGFNAGLELPTRDLVRFAEHTDPARRLFRFEGAAMASALQDLLPIPGRSRWAQLAALRAPTRSHVLALGRGWAYAALGRRPAPDLATDPAVRGAELEGMGFHDTVFARPRPTSLEPARASAYLHGVGRALWFTTGAEPAHVGPLLAGWQIDTTSPHVWSGLTFAATMVGAGDVAPLERLAAACPSRSVARAGAVTALSIAARADAPPREMLQRGAVFGAPGWQQSLALDVEALHARGSTAHVRRLEHHTRRPG